MSNLQNNRISQALTPATVTEIKALLRQIEDKLPFLIGLTNEERKMMPKISRSNKLFVDDTLQACVDNSALLPPYLDIAEMRKDYELYRTLGEILQPVAQLYEKVRDTQILAGSEAYSTALMSYRMFQMAGKSGVPGLDAIVTRLSERFAGQGPSGSPEPSDQPGPEEDAAAG
ncbi:MAG: hypothetical protein SF053_04080 [Bacteroidia bacterium]|nr:hypothetical protein [Bacteroidia bacterium]